MSGSGLTATALPSELNGARALAVVAHPDDESFGLGAVLAALSEAGGDVRVLCLTRGEASTLGAGQDLATVRRSELARAAAHLGLHDVTLDDFPDGELSSITEAFIDEAVERRRGDAEVLVTFEPGGVTGHRDHQVASAAAERVAARHGLVLVEWGVAPEVAATLRRETGVPFAGLEGAGVVDLHVDRTRQRAAVACHASQATGNAVLARRLALQGDGERIRVRRPGRVEAWSA
jgi:LmbE family N-acetylglucosaminyl deacetylase